MKKNASILFLVLLFLNFSAKALSIDTARRTVYYNVGIEACIYHFDSVLIATTEQRNKNLLTEDAFLEQYAFQKKQYKNQHNIIIYWAEEWSKDDYELSRNIKASLNLLSKGNVQEAYLMIEKKLGGKKISHKNLSDFLFKAQLATFLAYEQQAIETYKTIAESPYANSENQLFYAKTLAFFGKADLAESLIKQLEKECQTDTICKVTTKYVWSKIQEFLNYQNEAAATLIEAEYLISKLSENSDTKQKLRANILFNLAKLQLEQNNFENALSNITESINLTKTLTQDDRLPLLTAAKHCLAQIYKKAGGNEQADTIYRELNTLYPSLLTIYRQKYLPEYADMLADFAATDRWFNKLEAYELKLKEVSALRKDLMRNNFPFFLIAFAENQRVWGQKTMDLDIKVYIAEQKWKDGREALLRINQNNPMLFGETLSAILDKLGSVKIALKLPKEAEPIFIELLTLRQKIYNLAPIKYKYELMAAFVQNGTVNAMIKNKELSVQQFDRAIQLSNELGEFEKAKQLSRFRDNVKNN